MRTVAERPPQTPIEPVTDVLHGFEITDPYRWLEQQDSARTRHWIQQQTSYAQAYFNSIPYRQCIRTRVTELLKLKGSLSEPWNVGDRYFFLKHRPHAEQPMIVMREHIHGSDSVLLDPGLRATGENTSFSIVAVSSNARLLAYSVRQGGADTSSLEIFDVDQNRVLPDRLPEGLCTGFAFATDGSGFYYSHRRLQDPKPNYRAVFWHSFGSDPSLDPEVFFAGEEARLFVGILCSSEANMLGYVICNTAMPQRASFYLQSLPHESHQVSLLIPDVECCFVPFFAHKQLFAYTDYNAPNFRIVHIDFESPEPNLWRDVVPETDRRIQQFAVAGDEVFVTRVRRFSTDLEVFQLHGQDRGSPLVSVYGSIDLLNCAMDSQKAFWSQTSISEPAAIYCCDAQHKRHLVCGPTASLGDPFEVAIEEVEYASRDETSVPLLLVSRRDRLDSGPLPTFLTGYGGFASCVTPRFTAFATFLIEQGFLFAVPALRGGAELGENWHRAGMRENRQNAFDDFVAAAEWLVAKRRAALGQIAIGGGSNAGLLVGAAITQRPDLFRAAICLGPLLDMARYHLFDLAAGWSEEYGSPDNGQDCKYLLRYSPYHRVRDGVAYPAVLLISGDSDTRCNPMHARKMAARLQAATASGYPILLDYKSAWGHTPAQPLSKRTDALADRLAFVCHELGVPVQVRRSA